MKTTRPITKTECHWLEDDMPVGTTVFNYNKHTYGCISRNGRAYSLTGEDVEPFVELPPDAISND